MGDRDSDDIRATHPFRPKDIKLFMPYLKPLLFQAVLGIILTVFSTFLLTLLPLTSKVVIDFVIEKRGFERLEALLSTLGLSNLFPLLKGSLSDLKTLITILVAGGILIGLFNIAHRYLMVRVQQGITYNLQKGLFERILRFPFSFFRKEQSGYLLSRITDDINGIQYLFTDSISQIITRSATLLFGVTILLGLNYRIALIVIATIPLYILLNIYFGRGIKRVSHREREAQAVASREIQEVFSGMEVVKAHVTEDEEGKRISESLQNLMQNRVRRLLLSTVSVHSVKAIQFVATLLVIWYGVAEITKNRMTVGDYVAFTAYIIALSGAANSLSWVWLSLQPVFASL
ncbi:MAG: ABC transporter ATP-binding protein, partial [Nitrospirae bacterium]